MIQFAPLRLASISIGLALCVSSCASTSHMTLAEKRDTDMKKCFDEFQNYPTQRNACVNRVRTNPEYKELGERS